MNLTAFGTPQKYQQISSMSQLIKSTDCEDQRISGSALNQGFSGLKY
jgi:hypothetical protein